MKILFNSLARIWREKPKLIRKVAVISMCDFEENLKEVERNEEGDKARFA